MLRKAAASCFKRCFSVCMLPRGASDAPMPRPTTIATCCAEAQTLNHTGVAVQRCAEHQTLNHIAFIAIAPLVSCGSRFRLPLSTSGPWRREFRSSPLIGGGGGRQPLTLKGDTVGGRGGNSQSQVPAARARAPLRLYRGGLKPSWHIRAVHTLNP